MVTERLAEFLRDAGASDTDIEQAVEHGWLPVLVLDRLLMPGVPEYDVAGLAAASGTDEAALRRLWRALGFPDLPDGLVLFTEHDLEAVQRLRGEGSPLLGALGALDEPERPARIFAATLARIAAYEVEVLAARMEQARALGFDDEAAALAFVDGFDWDGLAWFVDYLHRLQLRAAAWRRLTAVGEDGTLELGVGFVDLARYTELSEELDDEGLAGLLDEFETVCADTVAEHGGRVVKTIGDEVMFVGPPDAVAAIALAVLERAAAIEVLPSVRIGVSFGPVLARAGDYFGPVVNLASRITDRARPGTILASEALHDILDHDPRFAWRTLAPRRLRGIGAVRLFALRAGSA